MLGTRGPFHLCLTSVVLSKHACALIDLQRADEDAARLYEEFVESFKAEDGPGAKAFVRGGTINPDDRGSSLSKDRASATGSASSNDRLKSEGKYTHIMSNHSVNSHLYSQMVLCILFWPLCEPIYLFYCSQMVVVEPDSMRTSCDVRGWIQRRFFWL